MIDLEDVDMELGMGEVLLTEALQEHSIDAIDPDEKLDEEVSMPVLDDFFHHTSNEPLFWYAFLWCYIVSWSFITRELYSWENAFSDWRKARRKAKEYREYLRNQVRSFILKDSHYANINRSLFVDNHDDDNHECLCKLNLINHKITILGPNECLFDADIHIEKKRGYFVARQWKKSK